MLTLIIVLAVVMAVVGAVTVLLGKSDSISEGKTALGIIGAAAVGLVIVILIFSVVYEPAF